MSSRIKLLFIHHGSGIGGAPISLLNLIRELNPEEFECKVVFFEEGDICTIYRQNNIQVDVINAPRRYFSHHSKGQVSWIYAYKYLAVLVDWFLTVWFIAPQYLKSQRHFDIVHLNSDVLSSWAAAAKRLGFKVVCHNRDPIAQGTFGVRKFLLRRILLKYVDKIISISIDNSHRLGLPDITEVVYNFVTIPEKYRLPFISSDLKVLYLGGSAQFKGFNIAVSCLQFLDENVQLQFAGNLNNWKEANNLKDWFINCVKMVFYRSTYKPLRFMKHAKNSEVLGLLTNPYPVIDACDVLITPFTVEHFSRPAMEAFAYGKPVIGSNVEGMDEIIDHGVNGLLFNNGDARALADCINQLNRDRQKASEMAKKAREKAIQVYSPKKNTLKVQLIYRDILRS